MTKCHVTLKNLKGFDNQSKKHGSVRLALLLAGTINKLPCSWPSCSELAIVGSASQSIRSLHHEVVFLVVFSGRLRTRRSFYCISIVHDFFIVTKCSSFT